MKNLLVVLVLLFSSIAFADDTTLALTGLTIEKGQVVKVEVISNDHAYINVFRAPTDIAENDEVEVVLEDIASGIYKMYVTVNESDVRKAAKGEFAIGKALKQQVTTIIVE